MDGNMRPTRVGLVNAAGRRCAGAAEVLLADMAEAGAVYERRSGVEKIIAFDRVGVEGDASACDAVVVALDVADARFGELLGRLRAGCAVYAACLCDECRAEEALATIYALEEACDQRGLVWRGALAIEDAQVIESFAGMPRMGFWRRPVFEAVDCMLLAVRCGAEAGRVPVRQGWLRRLRARLVR